MCTVNEDNYLGEFGRVCADLGMPKYITDTRSTAKGQPKRPKGQPKGGNGCPKMRTWNPYGRQMAAEASCCSRFVPRNPENAKRHNRC